MRTPAGGRILASAVLCLAVVCSPSLAQYPTHRFGQPSNQGLPQARPEQSCSLVNSVEETREVLESFAKAAGSPQKFSLGKSKAYGDFLVHVGKAGRAVDAVNAVLNVLDRSGGFDHGELMAVLGELIPFLPARYRDLAERAQGVLTHGLTALEGVRMWREAYEKGELPPEVEQTIMSSIAGLADQARRGLLKNKDWKRIVESPVAEAGRLILLAPPDQREALAQDFIREQLIEPGERYVGDQLKKQSDRLVARARRELSPQLISTLFALRQDPSLTTVANAALARYGLQGERAVEKATAFANKLDERFQTEMAKADRRLLAVNGQLAGMLLELGLDVGSLVGGPTVGRICTAARGCVALAKGDYLSAGFAALELLPVLREMAYRNRAHRAGAIALQVLDLAKEFHKAIQFVAKMQRHVEQGQAILSLVQGTASRLRNGESLENDQLTRELVSYGLDRANLPRLGRQIDDVTRQLQTANTPLARLARAVINPGEQFEEELCRVGGRISPVRRALSFFQNNIERPLVMARERVASVLRPATQFLDRLNPLARFRPLPDDSLSDVDWVKDLMGLDTAQVTALRSIYDHQRRIGHFPSREDLQSMALWIKGAATQAGPRAMPSPTSLESRLGFSIPSANTARPSPYAPSYYEPTVSPWPENMASPYSTYRPWPSNQPSPYGTVRPWPGTQQSPYGPPPTRSPYHQRD